MRNATLLAGLLVPTLLVAARPVENAKADGLYREANAHLSARAFEMGLDNNHKFSAKNINTDAAGIDLVRMTQTFKGVRVFEGETVLGYANGVVREKHDSLVRGLRLNVTPSIDATEALAAAHAALAPKGEYSVAPTAELVITTFGNTARPTLVYHVHAELENDVDALSHTEFFVSARTGAILKTWNSLHTGKAGGGKPGGGGGGLTGAPAIGTGNSQYSGIVALNTTLASTGYAMLDQTRGTGGTFGHNAVTNMNRGTRGNGTVYQADADNIWGDGANYVEGSSTTAANGQTAAVDAQFGVAATWDMFKKVFGRNGIDGLGTSTFLRVHYNRAYDNAFWSDSCFCMTFGDGSSFQTLTSIDVAGHEMTHGVCSRTAKLVYSGESGGLNEANSDIMGAMVEFYGQGGGLAAGASTIPETGGNFEIGEQLATPSYNKPLRYMYKPSLDGRSPDFYSSTLGTLDVHYSSGVANHFFYLLSQGTTNKTNTTNGITNIAGIGNNKAAHIWYNALLRMTSSTNYAGARAATIAAANALVGTHGITTADAATVATAWTAVNVN